MSKSSSATSALDIRLMKYALALARKGYGGVFPNPPVGAVIAKNTKVISASYHKKAGSGHAEKLAIEACKEKRDLLDSTLYVTLEPCSHFGRTPPCTDAIIEAGISRVVFGTYDPTGAASGGAEILKEKGIQVELSEYASICMEFLEPWRRWVLNQQKTLDVYVVLSLNGLMLADTHSDSNPIIRKALKRYQSLSKKNVQSVTGELSSEELSSADPFPYYHLGSLVESPEKLKIYLEHSCFSSLRVIRIPLFAKESSVWKVWNADVSLMRKYVQKSASLSYEIYGKV